MKASLYLAVLFSILLAETGCGGPKAFTRGTYEDPNVIEMLSDRFNENDLQLIAKKTVQSLSASPVLDRISGQPLIVIGRMRNSTSEHIDMQSLADKILVQLSRTGKFALQDKGVREEVADESAYQGVGFSRKGNAKHPAQQPTADYMMTGEISSIVQEVGTDKVVYYKFTAKLHNLRNGIVEWTDEKELRKKFEKQSVTW